MTFTVRQFQKTVDDARWNEFVSNARQSSFLFNRGYMDYHADRFTDMSLMVFKGDRLFALLPGNRVDGRFVSHGGLTYGGLLSSRRATVADLASAIKAANDYLSAAGVNEVIYKPTPYIYHVEPADEDLYCLWRDCGATIIARQISSTIDRDARGRVFDIRRQGMKKALRNGVTVAVCDDFASFWPILETNLQERYATRPVHTLDEMKLLAGRFPDNIKLWVATLDGMPVGGCVMYMTRNVAHSQYISASEKGKEVGALDLLFGTVIEHSLQRCRYFDFGISTELGGQSLNESLIYQKEGFGGRATLYDIYRYQL